MNLNLNTTSQRFTITSNPALTTAKPTTTASISGAKLLNSRAAAELRYLPVVMNNNIGSGVGGGIPTIQSQLNHQQQHHYPAAAVGNALPTTVATASGSLLHILPMPMPNGAGGSVLTSGTTLLPQMTLITSGVAQSGGAAGGLTMTQTTLAPLNVATTNGSTSSNNAITTNASGNQLTLATPINVVLTGGAAGASGVLAGSNGSGTGVMQHTANAGLATSILIRNQPQYSNTSSLQRNTNVLPLLNQELVKQIVVGNAPAKSLAVAPTNSATLLKASQPPKQQHTITQALPTKKPLPLITKLTSTNNKQQSPLAKAKVTSAEVAKTTSAIAGSSYPITLSTKPYATAMQQEQSTNATVPIAISTHQTGPESVLKSSAAIPADNNNCLIELKEKPTIAVANDVKDVKDVKSATAANGVAPEPTLKNVKTVEKQESLLKARSVQRVIADNTSPRSKRSKSLNCTVKVAQQNLTTERRHSSASEDKCTVSSPPSSHVNAEQEESSEPSCLVIDLIDEIDEEQIENECQHPNNENALEAAKDEIKTITLGEEKAVESAVTNAMADGMNEVDSTVRGLNTVSKDPPQIKIESNDVEDEESGSTDVAAESLLKDTQLEEPEVPTEVQISPQPSPSLDKSLYCDEKISISSSSSNSTTSSRHSMQEETIIAVPNAAKLAANAFDNSYSCVLKMLASFNMLTWDHLVGTARGTNMRFKLNEFNLLEVREFCPTRSRIHTAYEKPIFEREAQPKMTEQKGGLLYLCRRCNCHGPDVDFLAPEFCSLQCLKRDMRKRQRETFGHSAPLPKRGTPGAAVLPATNNAKKQFRWSTYLPEKYDAIAAPVRLFLNPFPTGPNDFQIGMKLEAIDPENCALFCVCTVVDIQGYRLKLTFDGYEFMYDFWVNADSMDIFPPGWCAKTNRILQPPKGKTVAEFNWPTYLSECKAIPAQRQLFTHLNASSLPSRNPFKVGMHLEAEDLNDTGKLCVASVADVLDDRIRIHFDGWDDCYDYWVDINSPYIHPCGWHVGRQQLIVPPEFENTTFNWPDYIKFHGSGVAAQEELFAARDPINFKPNMKLEVVDPRNPSLIRPATVVERKGHRVKLHLDAWPNDHCFWLEDDSPDLHPIGWCEATGHDLEAPPGYKMRPAKLTCPTIGCRGIGNAKRLYLNTHATREHCPYASENWRQKVEKPPRLEHDEIVRSNNAKPSTKQQQQPPATQHPLNDKQILEHIHLLDNIKTRRVVQQEKSQIVNAPSDYNSAFEQQLQLRVIKQEIDADIAVNAQPPVDMNPAQPQAEETCLKIAKEFLYDYGPRLHQNYNIWQQNVAFDVNKIKRNPLLWSTKDTCAFVEHILQSAETATAFAREDIDGNALLMLQQSDLTDMLDLKLGPAVKLYSCILQLRTLTALKFEVKCSNA